MLVRGTGLAVLLLGIAALAPGSLAAQRLACDRCHGELELLRQQVSSLAQAERLLAPAAVLRASAHGKLSCTDCHSGIDRYPHSKSITTRPCASCHEAADSAWRLSVHANVRDREPTGCTACHGVHDVDNRRQLQTSAGMERANARCSTCHQGQQLPASDAHAGRALCAACHGAHDVRQPELAASAVHPLRQLETCGTCHDSVAAVWRTDVHADTLSRLIAAGVLDQDPDGLPGCTGCHGTHGQVGVEADGVANAAVARCARCHEHDAESYYESYHGQAVRLGSRAAAGCADCHGAHGIQPSDRPTARTAASNLTSTCGVCHQRVNARFVGYDSHPEPMNRARNPWIFLAFWSMNALLVGAIGMWGLHTGLWWLRLLREQRQARPDSN